MHAMEGTSSAQNENTLEVTLKDNIRPLIKSCLDELTQPQYVSLISGKPDEETTDLLKDLLLDIISIISTLIQETIKTQDNITKEEVMATIGDTVSKSFADVMEMDVDLQYAESLTSSIIEVVTERVNSGSVTRESISPVKEIDGMVAKTCKLFRSFLSKICKPKRRIRFPKRFKPVKQSPLLDTIKEEEEQDFTETQAQLQSVALLTQEEAIVDEDVWVTEDETTTNKESIVESGVDPIFTPEEKREQDQEEKEEKCKILVKTLVEDLILLMFKNAQMACSQKNSEDLRKRLYDRIWAEVEKLDFNVPQEKLKKLEKTIYNDLCGSITFPQLIAETCLCLTPPFTDEVIASSFKKNIAKKQRTFNIFSFQGKNNQKPQDHKKPSEMINVNESVLQDQTSELTPVNDLVEVSSDKEADLKSDEKRQQDQRQREERCKMSIDIFLRALILRLYKKAHVKYTEEKFEALYKRLYDKMLAEAEKKDFNIRPEKFKNLEKTIYKDLCKRTACPPVIILINMKVDEAITDEIIINSFAKNTSEKPGRFFSSLWENIKKPFRCQNKVASI